MACINIPCFSLQLLCAKQPEWKTLPAVVVTEDKPLGIILEANRAAKHAGVKIGMRYSTALTIEPQLRAGEVPLQTIETGSDTVFTMLLEFSPEVEPFSVHSGVYWVNAGGLDRLFGSTQSWVATLQNRLKKGGFSTRVSVGYSRFGTFVAAKRSSQPVIFLSKSEERRYINHSPLSILPMEPKASIHFQDLGIRTVGDFIDLPTGGVNTRFSREIVDWHRFASGKLTHPVQPINRRDTFVASKNFQPEVKTLQTVLHHVKRLLDHLLTDVMKHNELIHTLDIHLYLENGTAIHEPISPAKPTVRHDTISRLVTKRLETVALKAGVRLIELSAQRTEFAGSQGLLFFNRTDKRLEDGAETFALIRAELGNDSIQVATITPEHLPERQFEWKTVSIPQLAEMSVEETPVQPPNLVRQLLLRPISLANRKNRGKKIAGPFRIQTSWWSRIQKRDYFYVKEEDGSLSWIYESKDSTRRFVQGSIL